MQIIELQSLLLSQMRNNFGYFGYQVLSIGATDSLHISFVPSLVGIILLQDRNLFFVNFDIKFSYGSVPPSIIEVRY